MPREGCGAIFAIPVPINLTPNLIGGLAEFPLNSRVVCKVLPRDNNSLNEEGSFHYVAAIIEFRKWQGLATFMINPVRECSMESLRLPVQKPQCLQHHLRRSGASKIASLRRNHIIRQTHPGSPAGSYFPFRATGKSASGYPLPR